MKTPKQIRSSRRWTECSKRHKHRQPLCLDPFGEHGPKEVDEVHHIVPIRENPGLAFDPSNLASLCKKCHEQVESISDKGYTTGFLFENLGTEPQGGTKSLQTKQKKTIAAPSLNVHDTQGGRECRKIQQKQGLLVFCYGMKQFKKHFCPICDPSLKILNKKEKETT